MAPRPHRESGAARRRLFPLVPALALLLGPATAPLAAHRLDELLQVTFVSVGPERIDVEVALTPGALIGSRVIAALDLDGDRRWSADEQRQYAEAVLAALRVEIDGRARRATLVSSAFPTAPQIDSGVGTIRVRGSAPSLGAGRHVVTVAGLVDLNPPVW